MQRQVPHAPQTLPPLAGFITRRWFRFRVWIKGFLKRVFTCRLHDEGPKPRFEDMGLDDRGHDNYMPGYFRRQMQFIAYKIISQAMSMVFFLTVTPLLRNGQNSTTKRVMSVGGGCQNKMGHVFKRTTGKFGGASTDIIFCRVRF
eukprot:m.136425 g.136425  ORF g.136425 m.136425 type:complete len:145 (+) comp16972_c1_seq2:1307-1741(+)